MSHSVAYEKKPLEINDSVAWESGLNDLSFKLNGMALDKISNFSLETQKKVCQKDSQLSIVS